MVSQSETCATLRFTAVKIIGLSNSSLDIFFFKWKVDKGGQSTDSTSYGHVVGTNFLILLHLDFSILRPQEINEIGEIYSNHPIINNVQEIYDH